MVIQSFEKKYIFMFFFRMSEIKIFGLKFTENYFGEFFDLKLTYLKETKIQEIESVRFWSLRNIFLTIVIEIANSYLNKASE